MRVVTCSLPCCAELGPQLGDRRVEVELAAARQHMSAERRGALGAGEDDAHRVPGPRRAGLGIGDAAPQIDHGLAADRQADRGADLALVVEVLLKASATRSKPGLQVPSVMSSLLYCGSGSLNASSRKRAACDSAVSLMPWPTPSAMCRPTFDAVLPQRFGGALAQHMRQHLVAVAVRQQYRRPRLDLVLQDLRPGQHAGEADDAGQRLGAAQADDAAPSSCPARSRPGRSCSRRARARPSSRRGRRRRRALRCARRPAPAPDRGARRETTDSRRDCPRRVEARWARRTPRRASAAPAPARARSGRCRRRRSRAAGSPDGRACRRCAGRSWRLRAWSLRLLALSS